MKTPLWAQGIQSWPLKLLGTFCSHCTKVLNQQLTGLGGCFSEYFYAVSVKAASVVMMGQIIIGYTGNLPSSKYWYITFNIWCIWIIYIEYVNSLMMNFQGLCTRLKLYIICINTCFSREHPLHNSWFLARQTKMIDGFWLHAVIALYLFYFAIWSTQLGCSVLTKLFTERILNFLMSKQNRRTNFTFKLSLTMLIWVWHINMCWKFCLSSENKSKWWLK